MLDFVKSLSRIQKRVVFVCVDLALIPLALLVTLNLQMSTEAAWAYMGALTMSLPYLLALTAALSVWLGVSSIQLNQFEGSAIGLTAVYASLVALSLYLLAVAAGVSLSSSVFIVFGTSFFVLVVISRALLLQATLAIYRQSDARCQVLIYGAGTTGMQLVSAFRGHRTIEPVAFVDDNAALQGMRVARLPVHSPVRIPDLVREYNINRVLLAMPSQSQPKQAQIATRLQKMGLEVQALPSFAQLIGEEELVEKLQPINPRSLLNRAEIADTLDDGIQAFQGRSVLISGAGGSIGSELCRQVLDCRPKRLVLFELSEHALYQIHQELSQLEAGAGAIDIVPILGSVTDARHVRKVLGKYDVQVVLHAAAYKHVPLVESNPMAGLANNVLGTQTLAVEAADHGIDRFILISSDKAVRPTNVMGASKRMAELVIQDLASRVPAGSGPIYTIVRFGNVLGSSGSVIPLFQEQLRRGGPLTVTHEHVARYFMTVQEAVTLVLRAGAMAQGGETYVLDMGNPVRIANLARQVIESAGYTVKDADNPRGDIGIIFTGLRPGEKMTEELTLSGSLIGTKHKKILFTNEDKLSEIEVAAALRGLRQALAAGDEAAAIAVATRWVEGYGSGETATASVAQAQPVT